MPPKQKASAGVSAAVQKVRRARYMEMAPPRTAPAANVPTAEVAPPPAAAEQAATSSPQPGAAVVDPALLKLYTESVLTALAENQPANREHADQDTPAQLVHGIVDTPVNSITGNCESTQSHFRSASMSITADIPKKVKAKIWAREYVQMEELLHETGDTPMMLSFDPEATLGLTLVPKPFKKTPLSIAQWSLAWNRFVAVLSEQQTNLAPQLAQHMELIMKIAQKKGELGFL